MTDLDDHITIRELHTLDEFAECCELQEEIWGRGFSERVPTAILRVSQKIGGVTAGAFDQHDRMLGFVFGMTGIREGKPAHWSDMLAVREAARGRHIGDMLKHYQRERVKALGVDVMLWTADPLVARNAHFNINRLGAVPAEYVENIYGANTGSTLHGALPTDRLVISWQLSNGHEPSVQAGRAAPGDLSLPLVNPLERDGLPRVVDMATVCDAKSVRVQIPIDLTEVQRAGDDTAIGWRLCVRAAFTMLLGRGFAVTRFVRAQGDALPYYVFNTIA